MVKAPIFAISRLRMKTDGNGITTLVAFMGCPLRCKYCLNEQCHQFIYEEDGIKPRNGVILLSAQDLYDKVKIDNIYFQATGGGICFGGGEPTLYPGFIEEFKQLCGERWKVTLETSLCCTANTIRRLSKAVDAWIVDIKSVNENVYQQYTERKSEIIKQLTILQENVQEEKVTIKVPVINGFNTEKEVDEDIENIRLRFGFSNIIKIQYIANNNAYE